MNTQAPEALHTLTDEIRQLDPVQAAEVLGSQPYETIHAVLSGLPAEQVVLIASHLPGSVNREEAETIDITDDIKGTVRELMVAPVGVLPESTTVAGALDHIVHTVPASEITYLYVVDSNNQLAGVVVMRDLLLASPRQTLGEIMTRQPLGFSADMAIAGAVKMALKKRFRLYPVIDDDKRIIGLIYGWQLFERVASEISAQTGAMVGLDREERVTTPFFQALRMRHPWLQVNLLTAFAAAFVVGMFEDTIARVVALAVFLPVLAGQSGNTGCQALAITLRGLTLGELGDFPVRKLLLKEIMLGAVNGFLVGLVAALAMAIYATYTGADQPIMLGFVVLLAMTGACVGSGIFGVMVPLILRRFGADPATASSIFLTTFTDIIGMGLMLFLATSLLIKPVTG